MEQEFLGIITPDAFGIKDKIFEILEENNFEIKNKETILLKNKDIDKLCKNPQQSIYKDWKKGEVSIFLVSKKQGIFERIKSIIWKKSTEIELRKIIGKIDQPNTIRGKFALSESKCAIYIPQQRNSISHYFVS